MEVVCQFSVGAIRFLSFPWFKISLAIPYLSHKLCLNNIQSLSASWWQSVTQLCRLTFFLVLRRLFVDVQRLCCLKSKTDLIIRIMLTNDTPFCLVFKRYMR